MTKNMLLEYFIFGVITFLMTGAHCEETEVFAEAGSQAVLPCKLSPSSPFIPSIIWSKVNKGTVWRKQKNGIQYWGSRWSSKGNQRIRCLDSQFERDSFNLQINSVREEDGGLYSCRMEHGDQVTENMVLLRIIEVSISSVTPIWGNDVSISCDVTPWPRGASVQWSLNSRTFTPQAEISPNRDADQRVVREKATARLTGMWTCVVGYKGKEGRASAALTVKGIVQPSRDDTKIYAAVGSAVTLPCVFSPGLIPSSPVWEKLKPEFLIKPVPGQLPPSFSPSSSSSQLSGDKSASLKEVGFEDAGRYRCSGTIEGQRLTRNMQLVVGKIDSSILPKNTGMMLTCQVTDPSEVTDYEWVHVVYDLNGTQSVVSSQKGKTLSISKASEENQGEWACRLYGKEGILGNITYHIQVMSGLSGEKSSGDVSHNTAAVVGLSFLLLVLLLILAQMYKNHQRKRRIFQYPAMETIIHTISNEREERERHHVKK